ncbi:acyl-CoA dehydrogenase family protein [Sabulicella glaciei]|uniref:Acyl-CoA dehydrogenase family protein n=1 Tax=Sabulicella glaciei TaxID=2984948 RepID=A0ABT3NRV2_9PROT|nr:acyl-CoA dehydrogenase family protein [Roseococcus sp. MDT2-1-1]MCW8084888.1 acyl-CoA dehydrogenase family protein [Roseococcus sp. MDT2-1-1]
MPDGVVEADAFAEYLGNIRRLVRDRLIPAEPRLEGEETLPEDLTDLLRQAGLFGISIPTRHGGLGLSMEQQVRVMMEVTYASAVFRARFSTTIGLGSQPILYNGTEAQRREWLPRMASGEATAAFCLTEPEAGSDAGGVRTRARRDGAEFVLDGSKRYITNARQAQVLIVMARSEEGSRGAGGISAFIVPRDTPGITMGPADRKMGQDGSATSEVYFDGVRVPETALIGGREGGGFKTAMRGINHARLHVATTCVGQAQRLLDEALSYARQRKQFGQPLAEFQLVQAQLADSRAELLAARSMVLETARAFDAAGEAQGGIIADIACCKLFASEMVGRVADRAVQIHGGMGYMRGTVVEQFFRDVRLLRIFEGASDIQRLLIAKEIMR